MAKVTRNSVAASVAPSGLESRPQASLGESAPEVAEGSGRLGLVSAAPGVPDRARARGDCGVLWGARTGVTGETGLHPTRTRETRVFGGEIV